MKAQEPYLEGMPEDPPRWVRPDESVRMSAQDLLHMLTAALPHTWPVGAEGLPQLAALHLRVGDGKLTVAATDRTSVFRERRLVQQTCQPWSFLLRAEDAGSLQVLLRSLLRGLKDEARDNEPCDLLVETVDYTRMLGVLGHDLDVRFTDHDDVLPFPDVDQVCDNALRTSSTPGPFDVCLAPTLLARTVPLQKARGPYASFRWAAGPGSAPVVLTTAAEADDVVVVIARPIEDLDATA